MDTDFLQDLIQVIEHGSIAKVAREKGLTPAAINLRIKKIEEELGFKLVVRSGRSIMPTPEGAQALVQAKRVMAEVRNLKAAAEGPMVFGHITLGAFDSAMISIVTPLVKRLITKYPNLEINLVKSYSIHLYGQVFDGDMDGAVALRPHFQLPKNIEWRRIRDEQLIVLAPESLKEKDPHQILRSNPLLCYDRKLWGGQLAADYLRQHNLHSKIRIETATIEVISSLVAQGLGVSLVPDCMDLPASGLRKVALPNVAPFRSIGLLWNRQSARAPLLNEIYEMLTSQPMDAYKVSSTPNITVD